MARARKEDMYLQLKHSGFPAEYPHTVGKIRSFIRALVKHFRSVFVAISFAFYIFFHRQYLNLL